LERHGKIVNDAAMSKTNRIIDVNKRLAVREFVLFKTVNYSRKNGRNRNDMINACFYFGVVNYKKYKLKT
jgi:hypothetical protein